LGETLQDGPRVNPLPAIASEIAELAEGYVMSQQRNIHAAATGGATTEGKGSLVELF
jgi:hypothetical protein